MKSTNYPVSDLPISCTLVIDVDCSMNIGIVFNRDDIHLT